MAATKKTIIKNLKWLLTEPNVKGKNLLRFVVWVNEVDTKYHENDIVRFSSPSNKVWGHRVEHMVGKIKKIRFMQTMYDANKHGTSYGYSYEIEATFTDGRTSHTSSFYIINELEDRLIEKKLRKLTENFIRHPVGLNYTESTDVNI